MTNTISSPGGAAQDLVSAMNSVPGDEQRHVGSSATMIWLACVAPAGLDPDILVTHPCGFASRVG
jgi:hypothetical protein